MIERTKERFLSAPWFMLPILLLGYVGFQEFHLVELVAWQIGAIALSPFIAIGMDSFLFPESSPSKLIKQRNHDRSDYVVVCAQLRRAAILIAIIIALSLGT